VEEAQSRRGSECCEYQGARVRIVREGAVVTPIPLGIGL